MTGPDNGVQRDLVGHVIRGVSGDEVYRVLRHTEDVAAPQVHLVGEFGREYHDHVFI